jgi:Plasmid pRiA4b ORF-3-like protein
MILIEGTSGREGTVATAGRIAGETPGMVYWLRVVLSGISPLIWRQLEVPATLTLAQLHEVLQISFAWSGERDRPKPWEINCSGAW